MRLGFKTKWRTFCLAEIAFLHRGASLGSPWPMSRSVQPSFCVGYAPQKLILRCIAHPRQLHSAGFYDWLDEPKNRAQTQCAPKRPQRRGAQRDPRRAVWGLELALWNFQVEA
jgi:hypothetical protein